MNPTLLKTLLALAPVSVVVVGSFRLVARRRSAANILQVIGAACLLVVVLAHLCEALHLLPWMHWGMEHSAGHYLDLAAVVGTVLFPLGYVLHAFAE